jgi:16S rRNA (cytosine967-C5)-methyltransferase
VSASPARRAAFEVVRRVFEDGAYADRAFRSAAEPLDARDRAFAMQLAYGTVQLVRPLDHAIETLARRPLRKLDPPVRAALRLGAYQLAYMGSVPAHAAVNETVELVRESRLERAVAFANAVMRRLDAGIRELIAGLGEETPQRAALKHSYPDWVAEAWWRELGRDQALALMRAQNEPPETAVRTQEGPKVVERIPDEWLAQGLAWPQSRGSQLAGAAVGVRPGERVLDLCAAPGGKATQLAQTASEVVAVEKHAGRARELEENAKRLGATNVRVLHGDALDLPESVSGFDRVLVDAPCSGLGVLNYRPDLRWRAEPLPDLQLELLRVARARTRRGGTVTYAVCTIHAPENEEVVERLGATVEDVGAEWPDFRHPRRPEFLLTLPHVHRTAGFFVARIAR